MEKLQDRLMLTKPREGDGSYHDQGPKNIRFLSAHLSITEGPTKS
jgi:hypothetical protein